MKPQGAAHQPCAAYAAAFIAGSLIATLLLSAVPAGITAIWGQPAWSAVVRPSGAQPNGAALAGPGAWASQDGWWSAFPHRQIDWLHIPKTGTSFGNTLLLWACPRLVPRLMVDASGLTRNISAPCLAKFKFGLDRYPGYKWAVGAHRPVPASATEHELASVFTMVRPPKERLASGFYFVHGSSGIPRWSATAPQICEFVNSTLIAHAARGAGVRLILGHRIHLETFPGMGPWPVFDTAAPPPAAAAAEACARLRRFAFVGVTNYWEASICLFHGQFGGRLHALEHVNVRKGRYGSMADTLKEVDCGDEADQILYDCAEEVFRQRLAAHPECLALLEGAVPEDD